jgi:predicted acetyltransferase
MDLTLRPLTTADEAVARAAHDELAADGFDFLLDWDADRSWPAYLAYLRRLEAGQDLPPDRVRMAFRVGDLGGELAGRTSIRFELDEWLRRIGGHVGYGVRPAFRRRGVALGLLRGSLALLRAADVERALVSCDDDNVGSRAVIERCGGVFERIEPDEHGPKRRYWIPTA